MKRLFMALAIGLSSSASAQYYQPSQHPMDLLNNSGQNIINDIRERQRQQIIQVAPPMYQQPQQTNCTSYVDAMGYTQTSCSTW